MAVSTAPARIARPSPSLRLVGGRGRPDRVTIRRSTLIEGLIEGIAAAQEGLSAAEDIQTAAATGSRALVINRAGRLGYRSTRSIAELRRLIADVEEAL